MRISKVTKAMTVRSAHGRPNMLLQGVRQHWEVRFGSKHYEAGLPSRNAW